MTDHKPLARRFATRRLIPFAGTIRPMNTAAAARSLAAATLLAGSLVTAGHASATDWVTGDPGGFYDLGGNWVGGSAPGPTDSVNFSSIGVDVLVTWDNITGDRNSASVLVDNSDVTFQSTGTLGPFLHTTASGTTVTNGGTLSLGDAATQGLLLDVNGLLNISDGSAFNVLFNSEVTANTLGVGFTTGDASIATIDGPDTAFNIAGTTSLGLFGSTGTLEFINSATNNTLGLVQLANSSFANSSGVLNVLSGSQITTASITAGTSTQPGQSSTILVDGTNSSITQSGASAFNFGALNTSAAQLTVSDGGTFNTGTGLTTINNTGTVNINTGGTFNLNGNLQINGGSLTTTASGFNPASGTQVTVSSNGQATLNGDYTLRSNRGIEINTGGDLVATGFFDISSAAVVVDGTGSSLSVGPGISEIGLNGTAGSLTVRNDAVYTTTGNLRIAHSNTTPSTSGLLLVESGADATINTLKMGEVDGNRGTATLTVTGTGSTLTQTGSSSLDLGNADTPGNGGVHTINVSNNGEFNTGTGTTTIRKTGTLNIAGGFFRANGDVAVEGGTINISTAGGGFDLAPGKTVTASAGGLINFTSFANGYTVFNDTTFNINDGADLLIEDGLFVGFGTDGTLNIDGAGSTLTINNILNSQFVGRIGLNGSTGVLTLRNGALGTLADEDLWIANFGTGSGTVNVESGADLNLGIIEMSTNDEGTSVINVTGSGSTLTQAGASALTVGSAGTSSATISVNDSGVFNTGTGVTTINQNASVGVSSSGTFNVNGDLVLNGGTVGISADSTLAVDGDITINSGTLQDLDVRESLLANNKNLLATNNGQLITERGVFTIINRGQTATFQTDSDWTHTGDLAVGSVAGDGTLIFDGSGSRLDVSGVLELSPFGSNTGVVTIQNNATAEVGILAIARSSTNAGTVGELNILSGGDMTTGQIRIGDINGNQGTGTINIDGADSSLTQIGGSALFLGNANTANNAVSAHTINVTNNGEFNTGTGTTTIRKTGTLNVNTGGEFNANGDLNINGGAVNVLGGTLNATTIDHSNGGQFNFTGGTLSVETFDGTLNQQGGTLAPGNSPGTTTITGSYNLNVGSLDIELAGLAAGTEHDEVVVGGALALANASSINLQLIDSLAPSFGDTYTVVQADTITGTFGTVQGVSNQPGLAGNQGLAVTYTASEVLVTAALLGDANLDGDVDVFEFTGGGDAQILSSNLGQTSGQTWADGDFNGDGDVDVFQFNGGGDAQLLSSNLGATAPAATILSDFALAAAADVAAPDALASAGTAEATYDASTGELFFDIGAGVGVVGLESIGNVIAAGIDDTSIFGAPIQIDEDTIAFFDANGLTVGEDSLGFVLETGLTQSDLGFSFTPLGGQSVVTNVTIIPEPSSLALLGLGGLLLGRRRK